MIGHRSDALRCTAAPAGNDEAWSDIPVDGGRTMVYGPRLGRLYLLPPDEALAPTFLRAIGLGSIERVPGLADPVDRILRDRTHYGGTPDPVPPWLCAAYRAFDASRHVVPLRYAAQATRLLACRVRCDPADTNGGLDSIARTLHSVEERVSRADCYPRALLTALLSLAAGRACTIVVGVLAPTRKLHAWCCVDGLLPYERLPEHYLYQPLWLRWLAP